MMTIPRNLIITFVLWLATLAARADSGTFNGLYYEMQGVGEVVIFIHGGQMDRQMWDEQFGLFSKQYCVIRYDIRGFGKSEAPQKPYSDASDLKSLLDHL